MTLELPVPRPSGSCRSWRAAGSPRCLSSLVAGIASAAGGRIADRLRQATATVAGRASCPHRPAPRGCLFIYDRVNSSILKSNLQKFVSHDCRDERKRSGFRDDENGKCRRRKRILKGVSRWPNINFTPYVTSGNRPNIGECWNRGTATFMILGNICTRSCKFCGVTTGKPLPPIPKNPGALPNR